LTCSSYDSLPTTLEDLEEPREVHSNSAATSSELMAHKAKHAMSLHVQFKDIHAAAGATTAEVSRINQSLRELKITVDERLLEIDSGVLPVRVMIPSAAQTIAFATDDRPLTSDGNDRPLTSDGNDRPVTGADGMPSNYIVRTRITNIDIPRSVEEDLMTTIATTLKYMAMAALLHSHYHTYHGGRCKRKSVHVRSSWVDFSDSLLPPSLR
jgi:hypothetical protein